MGRSDSPEREAADLGKDLCEQVGAREAQKARARAEREQTVWFGLGMFGLVGWSVAIPTLIAVALGVWIDRRWPSQYSWTLMLLLIGMALGCLNAWHWLKRERSAIARRGNERND